jgi:hypothetical protein
VDCLINAEVFNYKNVHTAANQILLSKFIYNYDGSNQCYFSRKEGSGTHRVNQNLVGDGS